MKKIPNLTALRFFLALLVVLYHIPQFCEHRGFPFFDSLAFLHKGQEAVYLFFSLSGFLIIRQLYIEKTTENTIFLVPFFLRRILRIWPLYYLILFFGFLYYRVVLPYFGFPFENNYNLTEGILLSITFFPNIFATYKPGGIIEILWSIGIEEQFYLFIAPLFFLLPSKKTLPFLALFTGVYFAVFFSESIPFLSDYKMFFFYFSFSGICSILLLKPVFSEILQKSRILIFAVFLIYLSTSLFSDNLSKPIYHLFSMILFGLTIGSLSTKPIAFLENKPLNYLGNISYGIYVFHAIAMQFAGLLYLKLNIHSKLPAVLSILLFNILVLAITIIVSHFSYTYYESYFLGLKHKFRVQKANQISPQS
ncbi:acyltransferase family protein [Flavobacterium aquicola]|uniref:Peptidoglycan/LPS O-acetylase OafA/YrhL n=1 Tax=Flavobacterium aquicola TaxID=1682742 RepID=A0A3E0EK46_9FLAO|nr:acyltransferase [Flavobacterium aquicola]REG98607.1 peptidoglycan/LPS O-acetylase OafA/YrhL [Flavobacterium aquicola]